MKVVINTCFGGFDPSECTKVYIASKAPELLVDGRLRNDCIPRHHPALVEAVERFGDDASTCPSRLEVVEIPDGIEYGIGSYDGLEFVYEQGHVWCGHGHAL